MHEEIQSSYTCQAVKIGICSLHASVLDLSIIYFCLFFHSYFDIGQEDTIINENPVKDT